MIDICDMGTFPSYRYFEQHELSLKDPANYPYEYTRVFFIHAEATTDSSTNWVKTFATLMMEDKFESEIPGTPRGQREWEDVTRLALGHQIAEPSNPFDFALWKRSRVVLILRGDFWSFAPKLDSVTTKLDFGDQYFDLRRHDWVDEQWVNVPDKEWQQKWSGHPSRCVSFFTGEPCRDSALGSKKVFHGFSLNIELVMPGSNRLPITIDPDVENKGGHN